MLGRSLTRPILTIRSTDSLGLQQRIHQFASLYMVNMAGGTGKQNLVMPSTRGSSQILSKISTICFLSWVLTRSSKNLKAVLRRTHSQAIFLLYFFQPLSLSLRTYLCSLYDRSHKLSIFFESYYQIRVLGRLFHLKNFILMGIFEWTSLF